ncbi:hypothetical protein A3Q40_01554 [Rhodococcus sp. PBTS 1]|nr:hypothetical protein A3Q40_01554 [Rhodococcus sp. PBTS 1]
MYRFRPTGQVDYFDLYLRTIRDLAPNFDEVNLDQLSWSDAERPFDEVSLRLALRHGHATGKGIVVDGTDLVVRDKYEQARAISPDRLSDPLPGDDLMEALSPGWQEHGRVLNKRIVANHVALVERFRVELETELATPPNTDLARHWSALGGMLPGSP